MSVPSARAVTMITGSSVPDRLRRSSDSTSRPLSPGISTSSSTRSNVDAPTSVSASRPSAASVTSNPRWRRRRDSASRFISLSSTTSRVP
jgi:hypothetical protein